MNYATDTTFLLMILVLPSLFGLSLIGEGVNKVMNYDPRGWVSVVAGGGFIVVIILAYFLISTNALG